MKKSLSLILVLILILSSFAPSFAISEKDLYEQSGQILKKAGVLSGSETGDLMLSQKLKRQDMVVLISRLYNEEHIAKAYNGKHNFKDVTSTYYYPYVAWAVDKGLIHGMSPSKFGFNEHVTVQQLQTVLLRALKYKDEARDENWSNIPSIAEKLNLMEGLSAIATQKLDRGSMAVMTLNALRQEIKNEPITLAQYLEINIPDPFNISVNATVDKNTLKLEGTAKDIANLKLNLKPVADNIKLNKTNYDIDLKLGGEFYLEIPNLQPGKYEYKFISDKLSTSPKTFTIKELPFELIKIRADNLKEIALDFSTPVDKKSSLFLGNYYTNGGTIKSVRLENEDSTIVLTLNETMTNEKYYKLSINKIKSHKGEELKIRDREFQVFDNRPPEVKEVKALGDKVLRIYMTEPVVFANPSNFKIDNKRFSGKVEIVDNVISLIPYIALSEGHYVLTVSNLDDYAGYKGIEQDIDFNIIKDTSIPKVVDTIATTEEIIIQFDKDIDPSNLSRTDFYWKKGSIKRYPDKVEVLNDQIILDFSKSNLPTYEIYVYISNIMDYWGNRLRADEIKVKPELDTTLPEVIGLNVSEDGKSITVYYNKNVEGRNRAFYTINDKDNRPVSIRNVQGSGREYTIILANPLPIGLNTITIQDVYDTTVDKNKIEPYIEQFYMEDVEKPTITSYSGKDKNIIITFNKEMDSNTVENYQNYIFKIDNERKYLPRESSFVPLSNNNKTWMITLPDKIDGKTVEIGGRGNIREIDISSIKAINGVLIDPQTLYFTDANQGDAKVEKAELIAADTIEVLFNQPIYSASIDDFRVEDRSIYDVKLVDDNIVHIILDDNGKITTSGKLTIDRRNAIETPLGIGAKSETISVIDKVPPHIMPDVQDLYIYNNTIELPFTEKLDERLASFFKEDIIVESLDYGILSQNDYSTTLDRSGEIIKINIHSSKSSYYEYQIRLVDNPSFIRDLDGNVVEPDNYDYFTK